MKNGETFREFVVLLQSNILGLAGSVGAGPNTVSYHSASRGELPVLSQMDYVPPQAGGVYDLAESNDPNAKSILACDM